MRKPLLAAPAVAMLILTATTSTLIQIVARTSPRLSRYRLKLLYWDGQGFCLYYKILEKGRFPWPAPADGVARLTAAQLAMLWEGIDWRRPAWSAPPGRVA